MSSKATTSGRVELIASSSTLIAENMLSRIRCGSSLSSGGVPSGGSIPNMRAINAAFRSAASSPSPSPLRRSAIPSRSFRQADSIGSPPSIPNSARITSPSAQ